MRIDLQVHTTEGSADSLLTPKDLGAACRAAGLDGVAVTEHSPSAYDEAAEILAAEDLIFVPGREVSCGSAHLLVFSNDRRVLEGLPRLASPGHQAFSRDDVACVWAHPASASGSGVYPPMIPPGERVSGIVHGVEVLNGRHLAFPASIRAAVELAASLGLPSTGGSDAHHARDLGRCFTEIDSSQQDGAAGVIDALRQGAVRPVLSEVWALAHGYDYRDDLRGFLG